MDLLRCFCLVAETRSFTATGSRLGRSQSAISVKIKKLEEYLGCPLLTRDSSKVLLTEQGEYFLPKALRILEQGERLLTEMRGPTVSGQLRIGILEYVAPHRIADLLNLLQRRLPGAELRFKIGLSSNLLTALDAGTIDLALALHDPSSPTSTPVAVDPLIWIESDQGSKTSETVDLCLMQAPCIYRQSALDTLAKTNVDYREVLTANSVQSVRNSVISGMGVTVLGASCLGAGLRPSLRMGALGALPQATISLHGDDHRKADIVATFQEILDQYLHDGGQVTLRGKGSEDAKLFRRAASQN